MPKLNQTRQQRVTRSDFTSADFDAMQAQANQFMKINKSHANDEHSSAFNEASFKNSDRKTKFYTGLTSITVFMVVLCFIQSKLPSRTSVSHFQQLSIILMKLQLAVPNEDLAYRFVICESTVGRIVNDGIDILFRNLSELKIAWKGNSMEDYADGI